MSLEPHSLTRATLAATLAAVGIALFGGVAWKQLGRSDEERAGSSFRAAMHCLVGDEDGAPLFRMRARAIAADLDPGQVGWPGRCAPPLFVLRERLDELLITRRQRCDGAACCDGDDRCGALASLRDEVDKALGFARYDTDFDPTDLARVGRELGLADGAVPEGSPTPIAPAPIVDPQAMTPIYEGDYLRLLTDPDGERGIELLFYEEKERYTRCTLGLAEAGPARCRDLDPAVPVGLAGELLAGEEGAPRRMYAQGPRGSGWSHGLYDVRTGAALEPVAYRPQGGFVWRDGSFAWLGLEPPMASLSLFRHEPGGEVTQPLPVEPAARSASPRLYHDEMIWAEARDGRQRLRARRLEREGLGPTVELGEIEGDKPPALELCRTREVLALLALTRHEERGARGVVMLRTSGWHAPHPVHLASGRFGFTCQDATATLTWIGGAESPDEPPGSWDFEDESPVTGSYDVHRLRCGVQGCEHDEVSVPLRRFSKSSRYVAGDLGEATVVMYRSPLGDVRLRLAPLEKLATAADVPLFDDAEHGGFGWDLERDPIFGRAGAMVVLLSRQTDVTADSSVYAFRVDAAGAVSPIGVAPATTPPSSP